MKSMQPSLKDVVEQVSVKSSGRKDPELPYIGLEHLAQGKPFLLGTASSLEYVGVNTIFEPNDILFGKLRPNLRKCTQVNFKGYCSTDILVLRPRTGIVPSFAAKVLQRDDLFDEAIRTAEGTKMPRTSWEKLKAFPVFIPCDDEQCRIAKVLDAVDAAIHRTDTLINKLKWITAGLLNDLLTRGLEHNDKLRDPVRHPEQFKDEPPFGLIPREWQVRKLTEVAPYQNGKAFPSSDYGIEGVPLLRPGNLPNDELVRWDKSHTIYLPSKWLELAHAYVVHGNELVMNLTAQSLEDQFLGRVCMTPPNTRCLLNQRIARFFAKDCHLPFLFWSLKGKHFRRQIDRLPQGTKVQHIYNENLNAIELPFPTDLDEQRTIAEIMWSHSTYIHTEEVNRDKLIQIRKGLMHDLLTGRVRVPAAKSGVVAV